MGPPLFVLDASCCRVSVSFPAVNDLCGDPSAEHGRRRKLRSIKPTPCPSPASRSTGPQPLPQVPVNLQHFPGLLPVCACSVCSETHLNVRKLIFSAGGKLPNCHHGRSQPPGLYSWVNGAIWFRVPSCCWARDIEPRHGDTLWGEGEVL